jgi:hypothetical protein
MNLYGLVASMAPNLMNLYGLVASMAPNIMNLYGLVASIGDGREVKIAETMQALQLLGRSIGTCKAYGFLGF